jgi:hypothetical protein
MGRNYFSKHGGPYFINDGFTHHAKPEPQPKPEGYIKPDIKAFYGLTAAFVLVILGIGIALVLVP